MKKQKKVLVVGGAGYIGGATTNELQRRKIPYAVYDNLLYEDRHLKPGGDFIFGDVRDTKKLGKIINKYTDVIWLAAIVGDGACFIHPLAAVEINEKAVKWLAKNFHGRILFTSSCSLYGSDEDLLGETAPPKPLSLYATTKINAERYLEHHPNTIIFRLGTAFGVSDTYTRLRTDLLVNTLTASALTRGVITVFGGKQRRPLIHVSNIASTLVHNLFTKKTGVYNIATGNYEVREVAQLVKNLTGCKVHLSGKRFEDNRHYHVTTEKARRDKVLLVNPKKDIAFGIREVASLIKSGRVKDVHSDVYINMKHVARNKV